MAREDPLVPKLIEAAHSARLRGAPAAVVRGMRGLVACLLAGFLLRHHARV